MYEPTPWYSYPQFCDAFRRLSDVNDYERLLFQLELWKARGRVPAAIHATSILLNAMLVDQKSELYPSSVRDLYAMSIIRTVNLILDLEQDSFYAKSMILMGKEASLPESIVRCRHNCSHGDIPDIESLRVVAREALNYVYRKYWLTNDQQYSFLLFSTFLLCRSGIDVYPLSAVFPARRVRFRPRSAAPSDCDSPAHLASVITSSNRAMRLIGTKAYLAMGRRPSFGARSLALTREAAQLFASTTAKIVNSCVHEDIFISLFVEYVFSTYRPRQSGLFPLLLFCAASQYSFNFTIRWVPDTFRLVAHMMCLIFGTPDTFTDYKSHEKDSVLRRVGLYRTVLPNCVEPKSEAQQLATNFDPEPVSARVNAWLVSLLERGMCMKSDGFSSSRLRYAKTVSLLPPEDRQSFLNYERTALSRVLAAARLLLPLMLLKVPNTPPKDREWNCDKVSHIVGLIKWLGGPGGSYRYAGATEAQKSESLVESKEKCRQLCMELNKNLLPGTAWDAKEGKVAQTYPLDGTHMRSTHEKIVEAAKLIARGNFINEREGSRKIRTNVQMFNVNRALGVNRGSRLRIQKKLFRSVSYGTNRMKTLDKNRQ